NAPTSSSATPKQAGGALAATPSAVASRAPATETPVRGGTLTFNSLTSIQDIWDPHFSVSTASQHWSIMGNLMLRPAVDGHIEGELIQKWEIPGDGTEIVMTVQDNVKWHERPPS